jgi:hypothetical protein
MSPHEKGRHAYELGCAFIDCPFPDNSEEALEWEDGFMEARDEDEDDEDEDDVVL